MTKPNLIDYRAEFDSLKDCHYLIANSLGAMPNRAREYMDRYMDAWATQGVRAWESDWWLLSGEVGNKIGGLINAAPDSVSMHPNVTSAEAQLLSCFEFNSKRNKVVMVELEFPSLKYLYSAWLSGLSGRGRLEIVPCPDGISAPMEQLLAAIDETTLLVPISNLFFRSGALLDASAVIERAHSVGAKVVLDVFQSIGVVPLDLAALEVDFAVGGCLKWLCGGPGACFLYVRPDLMPTLEPKFTGWLAHENPFQFESSMRYTTGSYRFQSGTPVIPALYTCQAGLDIQREIGIEKIRARSIEMTTRILREAARRGWPTITPDAADRRGGTVVLALPGAEEIARELVASDFLVDFRPQAGVRISPHFYNTDEEIDDLIIEIDRIQSRLLG